MRIHKSSVSATISCLLVRALALAAFCVCLHGHAGATTSGPDSLGTKTDTVVSARMLPEIMVEASSRKADRSTAPKFQLGASSLKAMGATDISSALKRLPGINLKDYGGAGGMKTVAVRSFGAAHTGVVYDGVTLSNNRSGEVDLSRYSLDNVGSLSLIIGDNDDIFRPARSIASASSLVISSAPVVADVDSLWLTAQMRAGSFGMLNPFLKVGTSRSGGLSVNFIGEFTHALNDYPFTLQNGIYSSRERRKNSLMNSGHGESNLTVPTGRSSSLTSKIYYYDNGRQLPGPVIYYNPQCNERLRERNAFAQALWRATISDKVSLRLTGKFNWEASLYDDVNGRYPGGRLDQDYFQREVYASGVALWLPASNLAFSYAADFAYGNLSSNLPQEVGPSRYTILQALTGRYRTGRLTATASLLGSIYLNRVHKGSEARDNHRLSPSASISFQPMAAYDWRLRASYKSIFRVPTFNESYFFHYGSTDLLPETTQQFNLGTSLCFAPARWLPRVALTADAYLNEIDDMIVGVPYNMFVWTMVNLDKVKAMGVDVTLSADVRLAARHKLEWNLNYSYQRSKPLTDRSSAEYGKQVAYIPLNSGGGSVAYTNPWVDVVVKVIGVGPRFTTNSNIPDTRIAGYVEAGISLRRSLRIHGHLWEAAFDIDNIFDKQYQVIARYPMPGRSWRLSLKFQL